MAMKILGQYTFIFALAFSSSAVALLADSEHAGHSGLGQPLPTGWEPPVHDNMINTFTLFQKAEFQTGGGPDAAVYDAEGWIGGDIQRFWWKAEGNQDFQGAKAGRVEAQALYSRLISPFWDFQTGLRVDREYGGPSPKTMHYFVVGLEGLAPYWFELEPTLFLSDKGRATFQLTTSYDQLITQRWVIQPRLDLNAAFQDDTKRNIAAGPNDIEASVRLRYDIRRNFSPYIGVTWRRELGKTANLLRRTGEDISTTSLVFGLRTWF